jgi:membrane fusion protein (multidrug efflux system)
MTKIKLPTSRNPVLLRGLACGVVCCAALGAGAFYYKTQQNDALTVIAPSAGAPNATVVEGEKVTTGSIDRQIEAVGTLASNESVVLAPEITGRITEILFEEGQMVKAGDPLIRLDDAIARAELAQAEASMILSKTNYDRAETLLKEKSGTARARDEALSKLRTDQAGVALAKAKLEKSILRAPFDATIGLRNVSVGDYVNPGQQLVNLEDIAQLKVDFRMPEVYLDALRVGQKIEVRIDAFSGQVFNGEVYAIDPRVDSNGRTVVLRARLSNEGGVLRPGLFARVNLLVSRNDTALLIPEQALIPQGTERYVYKVVDGKAAMTKVETGLRRGGQVEVLNGLTADDVIVTAGQMKLRPDMAVTVIPTTGNGTNSGAEIPAPQSKKAGEL